MDQPVISLHPLADADPVAIEALLDAAFGVDRRLRTAYRLREGSAPIAELSFAALGADRALLGSIQCWPVAHRSDAGITTPLILVGPVAVAPALQRAGLGRRLMGEALAAAGAAPMMLVGDPEYYERFGFSADRTGAWRLPGPFEPHRLLARGEVPASAGQILPSPPKYPTRAE